MATLIVMIAVLLIIILFCCFAAPGVRMMCKRYVFRRCMGNDPNIDNVYARRYGYDTRDEIREVNELNQITRKVTRKTVASRHGVVWFGLNFICSCLHFFIYIKEYT
ncbi:unnamed protein product [Phyllotreta striolata]|uniref:Uncharacterized protein n=1 Tax=Phyllotreta striolata TaxID=444603 RepID=A0A9N9TT92_PHYSR|nr:unnamed protein product [Phyllotreta striolata]